MQNYKIWLESKKLIKITIISLTEKIYLIILKLQAFIPLKLNLLIKAHYYILVKYKKQMQKVLVVVL